jgi:putative transposase
VASLLHYRDSGAYQLHGFVLMPDHFHALVTPSAETTLEKAMQFIKGGSSKRIHDELMIRFSVWQRGFSDHRIRDAGDYDSHQRYIAFNPVKRRLVKAPLEYKWSSITGAFPLNQIPQGLKPLDANHQFGTAEAVP